MPPECKGPQNLPSPREPGLDFRFRGVINAADEKDSVPGLGSFILLENGGHHDAYGIYNMAKLGKDTPSTRLEIDSFGPAVSTDSDLSGVIISMDASVTDRLDHGTLKYTNRVPYAVAVVVQDIWTDKVSGKPNKACVHAVLDTTATSWLYFCDAGSVEIKKGNIIKVFGSIALTWDPNAIEAYIRPFGLARCVCAGQDGKWEPCPEAP